MADASNRFADKQFVQDALRVSQLDASELDQELFEIFRAQINNIFKHFRSNLLLKFSPEINALLRYLFWHNSIKQSEATIGQSLLDLRYLNSKSNVWMTNKQKFFFALLTIGGPWIEDRIDDLTNATKNIPHSEKVSYFFQFISKFYKVAVIVNFLVFLCHGKHQFLIERILGMIPVFPRPHGIRQVGFEMMNRELLWHGFAEFLFFALPLINLRRIKNFFMRNLLSRYHKSDDTDRKADDFKECAICGQWPFNPHQIGCRHVFCYYCIQSNYKADPSFSCSLCGRNIDAVDAIERVPVQRISIFTDSS